MPDASISPAPESELPSRTRRVFARFKDAAAYALQRRTRVLGIAREAYEGLDQNVPALRRVRTDLATLARLVRAWADGSYRAVSWQTILYAVAGLLYFISPVDAIPDALFMIGFIDDAAVIAAVVRAFADELEAFRAWEAAEANAVAAPASGVLVAPERAPETSANPGTRQAVSAEVS